MSAGAAPPRMPSRPVADTLVSSLPLTSAHTRLYVNAITAQQCSELKGYPMTTDRIAAEDRVAPASDHVLTGPITLMNSFAVSPGRDGGIPELWARTAKYLTAQPGFISLRLHRAVSADAQYRWVTSRTGSRRRTSGPRTAPRVPARRHPARLGGVPQLTDALPGDHRNLLGNLVWPQRQIGRRGCQTHRTGCGAITAPQPPPFSSGVPALIRPDGTSLRDSALTG